MPGRHPGAVRRAHRRGRAPPGEPGGVLRAHPRPARGEPEHPARRLLDDPGGDRVATTPCCSSSRRAATGRRARSTSTASAVPLHASRVVRTGTEVTLVGHGAMVDRAAAGRRARRRRGHERRGHRPALALADRLRPDPRLGAEDRPARRRVRRRPASSSVGSEIAATVAERAFYSLEAPGAAGQRLRHPVPARKLEGHLPARRRPHPRGRRPRARLLSITARTDNEGAPP